jgi:hypothetical protein
MKAIREGLTHLGRAYWGLPDQRKRTENSVDRSELYFKWGRESGETDDFIQALHGLEDLNPQELSLMDNLHRHQRILNCIVEILRLKLRDIAEVFEFLCDHRGKIELRSLDFKQQLHDCICSFIDEEEVFFAQGERIKVSLAELELEEGYKSQRKEMLESFDLQIEEITEGLKAFYARVKEYAEKG